MCLKSSSIGRGGWVVCAVQGSDSPWGGGPLPHHRAAALGHVTVGALEMLPTALWREGCVPV